MAHVPTDEVRFISHSREETIEVGKQLGELVKPQRCLYPHRRFGCWQKLSSQKVLQRAWGITADVTSPTFTIEMVYYGPQSFALSL